LTKKAENDSEEGKLNFVAQLSGMKNMKITGGWQLTLDLFESDLKNILATAVLVNDRATVRITVEPYIAGDTPQKTREFK